MKHCARHPYLAAAAGAALAGCLLTGCGKFRQAGPPPQRPAPEVAVINVQPESVLLTTELAGRVSAFLIAEVRPQVTGIIQKRLFEEGGDVQAGDLLYQIDPAIYEANFAGAQATLARAEANVTAIRSRAERYKELVTMKAVSRQNYDDALAALKQAEAEIQVGKAAVETARINLAYTRVTAPIAGRIGKSAVTIGALVTANQPGALATIQQLDPIYVDVLQATADGLRRQRRLADGRLQTDEAGQSKVGLIMEDGAPYPLAGALQFRDITVNPASGSVMLRAIFPNPEKTLLPGMFTRAVISEGVNTQAMLVPQQAVTRDAKGNAFALLVDGEGKAQRRQITVDRALGDRWLVAAGLAPGDRVVVEGSLKVRPGLPVTAVPFEAGRQASAAGARQAPAAAAH